MSSHPCDTRKVAFQDRWLFIGGLFVYKMSFWGMTKWPPIGGWLLIRVAAHSRLYCTYYVMLEFISDFFHSLCNLYNWRYKRLGNLPHVSIYPEYRFANAGFFYDFQLVNVVDFNGVGESEPNPYFYQVNTNLLCDKLIF